MANTESDATSIASPAETQDSQTRKDENVTGEKETIGIADQAQVSDAKKETVIDSGEPQVDSELSTDHPTTTATVITTKDEALTKEPSGKTDDSKSIISTEDSESTDISSQKQSEPSAPKDTDQNSSLYTSTSANSPAGWSSYSSYLKKAVANVESKLDKVLQDAPTAEVNVAKKAPATVAGSGRLSMQERLAMAVGRPNSQTSNRESAPPTPKASNTPRSSMDGASASSNFVEQTTTVSGGSLSRSATPAADLESESFSLKPVFDALKQCIASLDESSMGIFDQVTETLEKQQSILEAAEFSRTEKITSLEAKLKYLAQSEADRISKSKGGLSGVDKKLAEKDEQIALLMAEGQTLANNELKHMNLIKKLRAKEREFDKTLSNYSTRATKAEEEVGNLRVQIKMLSQFEKDAGKLDKEIAKKDEEQVKMKKERSQLNEQLKQANDRIKELETKYDEKAAVARDEALTKANQKIEQTTADLEKVLMEKSLAEEIHEKELTQLNQKLESEIEKHKLDVAQLSEEVKNLEVKTEYYRSISEDKSASGEGGIASADTGLLQQMEILQAQHSIAKENWHEIEANLLDRVNALESEMEEVKSRESYVRKRLQTTSTSLKEKSDENEVLSDSISELKNSLKAKISAHEKELEKLNSQYQSLKTSADVQISNLKAQLEKAEKAETLRLKELEDLRKQISERSVDNSISTLEPPPLSEIPDNPPLPSPSLGTGRDVSSRESRRSSLNPISRSGSTLDVGTITEEDTQQDFFETSSGFFPPADTSTRIENSSVYTASGGASLQLVSKMNTTIRRLESELAISRHELEKVTKEKENAYTEVVSLMSSNEELSVYKNESEELKLRLSKLEEREHTALEMLGEKSEQVEELKADVMDLKQMYRQQIEQLADQLQAMQK